MKKGFTLIEVLVVVLIIGILAAIALPLYRNAVIKTKLTKYAMVAPQFKKAYQEWRMINGRYMLAEDLRAFLEEYHEFLGFESCSDFYGYTMCYFPDGERLQINNWFGSDPYFPTYQTLYYYFPNNVFRTGGATGIYIRLDTGYTYLSTQSTGINDGQSEHQKLCDVAQGMAFFNEVCGRRT